jgi:hypothetical protein
MTDGVNLGGIAIPSNADAGWVLQSLSDWMSVTSPKSDPDEMQGAHGSFAPGTLWRKSAVCTIVVAWIGDDVSDLERGVRDLNALAAMSRMMRMKATFGGVTLYRNVWVESVNVPDHHERTSLGGISIDVRSDSPFAYGETVTASCGRPTAGAGIADPIVEPVSVDGSDGDPGRCAFANIGTASTPLLLTVSGGGMTQGVRLRRVETGETLELAFPILPGQSCVFDSASHRVTLDNQSALNGYLTVDDWFDAPAGETTTVQFEPLGDITGNPTLTLTAAPAWY